MRLKERGLLRGRTPPDAAEVGLVFGTIAVQIAAISDLHRMLSADDATAGPDIAVQLAAVCAAMRSLMPGEIDIVTSFEAGCTMAVARVLPVTQICTELIANAIKHGRSPDGRARIRVSCCAAPFGAVRVEVADQGQGLPAGDPVRGHQGLGRRLADGLARQSGAEIAHLSTPNGLTARLTVSSAPVVVLTKAPGVTAARNGGVVQDFQRIPATT